MAELPVTFNHINLGITVYSEELETAYDVY